MKRTILPLLATVLLTACTTTPAAKTEDTDPQRPTISRQEAIAAAACDAEDDNWWAVLMKDYSPAVEGQEGQPPRDTWIVQRINRGRSRTLFVDAETGEVYFEQASAALAPTGTD